MDTGMLQFLAAPFVASLILTGIHAYLGVHVVERGVIFVDLSLAQIAALGATIAILMPITNGDPHAPVVYWISLAFTFIGATDLRGNLGENTFRRGGIRNLNAALSRTWSVRREKTITFRAESINVLNTPQFAEPGTDLASPSFGLITNTLNEGRTFQFQLRFHF